MTAGEGKSLWQTDNGNTYLGCEHCLWSKTVWCLSRMTNKRHRKLRQVLSGQPAAQGMYVLEPFGILWRCKRRNERGLPVREADLSLVSAPTQETGMLWVRTTQASLQFIILWGRAQLPRRQLSTARDPDIKPHSDCWMKKHYHLASNLIMLWERERRSGREIAGVIRTSMRRE